VPRISSVALTSRVGRSDSASFNQVGMPDCQLGTAQRERLPGALTWCTWRSRVTMVAPSTLVNGPLMARRSWADVAWFGALGALLLPRRLRLSELLLVHRDRWLPPSLDISPSYTCGIGITARLLTVDIWHKLRQPILW
jgi:hypothetical protein